MAVDDDKDLDLGWEELLPAESQPAPTKRADHITSQLAAAQRVQKATPEAFRIESPGKGVPVSDFELELGDTPRSQQRTYTNEALLEDARKQSARLSDIPPKSLSEASLDRAQLLSLADEAPVGGALDLVEAQSKPPGPPAPAAPVVTVSSAATEPESEMRDRFSLGDYSGALLVAEGLLEENPEHTEALRYAESCRNVLAQMYTARIGPLDRVPFIAVPREQLKWLSIDHRAGFVLSHVDGVSSLEQILDVSGMAPLDALRILYELAQQRVISFR